MIRIPSQLSQIELHELAVIYPSFGYLDHDQRSWKIKIHGAVYEPCHDSFHDRMLVRLLTRAMKTGVHELNSEIFRQRVSSFLAQHERGKRIVIRVGDKRYRLRSRTRRNGYFSGTLRLSAYQAELLHDQGALQDGWLNFEILTRRDEQRTFMGRAQLVGRRGLSVISDIDDTIKRSDVPCRSELLANTFLREYESIPGMSQLYQRWADAGAAFHYVSSSPWQLFQPLDDFRCDDLFPQGSYHLRTLRLKDPRVLSLLLPTRWNKWSKWRSIRSILRAFPDRRFVLVGDSGEGDPEIYGSAARKYPDRIARIYIRNLAVRSLGRLRREKAFRAIPRGLWRIFQDVEQLEHDAAQLRDEVRCLG